MKGWADNDFSTRYHFLRMMGRHRSLISKVVLHEISEEGPIDWLDHAFSDAREDGDRIAFDKSFHDRLGIFKDMKDSFLKEYMTNVDSANFAPSWDAIGKTNLGTIVLMNAVSYPEELYSRKEPDPRTIAFSNKWFTEFAKFLKTKTNSTWEDYYYAYVKEISEIWLLNEYGLNAQHITF